MKKTEMQIMKTPSAGETELRRKSDPLRQGDIIKLEDFPDLDHEFGVVINADCDLSHGKIDGVLAYLPVYSFDAYLRQFWVSDFIRSEIGIARQDLSRVIPLSENEIDELLTWMRADDLEAIGGALGAHFTLKEKQAGTLREKLLKVKNLALADDAFQAFQELCKSQPNPKSWTKKKLEEAKKNMGEGHFFVSEILGIKKLGYVVRMRRIHSLGADSCFKSEAAQKSGSDGTKPSAFRIAGLSPTYRFKVAQMFAQQYSRIGLPDDITALSDVAIEELVSMITGTETQ